MTAILTPYLDNELSQFVFKNAFAQWVQTKNEDLLDTMQQARTRGYKLNLNGDIYNVWLPTVHNVVVETDGTSYNDSVLFRCMNEDACFKIHCSGTSPYNVMYIDIDIIENVGSADHARHLKNIMTIANCFSVPVHYTVLPNQITDRGPFEMLCT